MKIKTKKIILGLVGETGSGKDTFCEYLKKKLRDVYAFRFSQPLTEVLGIFFDRIKKEDQQWLGTILRERYGNNILGLAVKRKIENIKKRIIVLNGIRAWEEYKMIKKMGGKIIYITADSKIRWQKIGKRGEKKDDKISYQKFLKLEKAKTEILISKIGRKADFKIENNGNKKEFYQKIKKLIEKI